MDRALILIALLAAAACSGKKQNGPVEAFSLASSAFENGQTIPPQFTCDGASQIPPLAWSSPPAGTKSFALIVDDPDAPGGIFRHWAAYDIPGATRSLGAGQQAGSQAVNDMGKRGYGGPCPPKGHGPHHYRFKLFALDVETLGFSGSPKVIAVENAAKTHAIGRAELIGTYERR